MDGVRQCQEALEDDANIRLHAQQLEQADRRHSKLGYVSPIEYERTLAQETA